MPPAPVPMMIIAPVPVVIAPPVDLGRAVIERRGDAARRNQRARLGRWCERHDGARRDDSQDQSTHGVSSFVRSIERITDRTPDKRSQIILVPAGAVQRSAYRSAHTQRICGVMTSPLGRCSTASHESHWR